jgi:hypothetical protein
VAQGNLDRSCVSGTGYWDRSCVSGTGYWRQVVCEWHWVLQTRPVLLLNLFAHSERSGV